MSSGTGSSQDREIGRSGRRIGRSGRGRRAHAKRISGNAFATLLTAIKSETDCRLQSFLDARLERAEAYGKEMAELVAAVRDLCLRGGKRLRPALLIAGYRASGKDEPLDPALDAGVSLELLQAYFLIHDDWMDGDRVRRGGPAVHALLGQRLRNRSLGEKSGILAGDYAAALAAEALSLVSIPAARRAKALACFAQMQVDAVMGQQLDVVGRAKDVEVVYAFKTSSYTVKGPLHLGAIMAGASSRVLGALAEYAKPVGIAFQLRDDLIGVFGDPSMTGKPLGSDLRSAKQTVLLRMALQRTQGNDRKTLERVLGSPRASEDSIRRAIELLEGCGARALVEARISELVSAGLQALDGSVLAPEGVELLAGAAEILTSRRY